MKKKKEIMLIKKRGCSLNKKDNYGYCKLINSITFLLLKAFKYYLQDKKSLTLNKTEEKNKMFGKIVCRIVYRKEETQTDKNKIKREENNQNKKVSIKNSLTNVFFQIIQKSYKIQIERFIKSIEFLIDQSFKPHQILIQKDLIQIIIIIYNLRSQMEGQVDLDSLIKKDKEKAKNLKTHQIQKANIQSFKKDRFKGASNHQRYQHRQNLERQPNQYEQNNQRKHSRAIIQNGYALFITGFVSDVSSDDIYNLARERKILSIRTCLKSNNEEPINQNNMVMEVIITFAEKQGADSFIKEYSNKKLDGKHSLTFQYRRAY